MGLPISQRLNQPYAGWQNARGWMLTIVYAVDNVLKMWHLALVWVRGKNGTGKNGTVNMAKEKMAQENMAQLQK